jgi:hypothetical protein
MPYSRATHDYSKLRDWSGGKETLGDQAENAKRAQEQELRFAKMRAEAAKHIEPLPPGSVQPEVEVTVTPTPANE